MKMTDKLWTRKVTWHERNGKDIRTGRTICVLWLGDMRFVGISRIDGVDPRSRLTRIRIAEGRARHMLETFMRLKTARRGGRETKEMFSVAWSPTPIPLGQEYHDFFSKYHTSWSWFRALPPWMFQETLKPDNKSAPSTEVHA